jgi:hypothetical protein
MMVVMAGPIENPILNRPYEPFAAHPARVQE